MEKRQGTVRLKSVAKGGAAEACTKTHTYRNAMRCKNKNASSPARRGLSREPPGSETQDKSSITHVSRLQQCTIAGSHGWRTQRTDDITLVT